MITVVGMGRKSGDLTMDGQNAIKNADVVVVKSQLTHCADTVAQIRNDAVYCDDLYLKAYNFDDLNTQIVQFLQSFGKCKVAFCVVGDGSDDSTVQLLQNVNVVCGVGLHSSVTNGNMPAGTAIFTAQDFVNVNRVLPQPTVIKCLDDKYLASEVQLKLLQAFDVDNKVIFSSKSGQKIIKLRDLCKQRFSYQTTLLICPKPLHDRQIFDFYDCADVLTILRSPNGCPWDREQTHKSIEKNVIEEAYELANALDNDDVDNIVEELGDLLMQVLFHLDIAKDDGEFENSAVFTALCRKLIDRHPHVFGDVVANNSTESLDVWEKQKQKEHKIKNVTQNLLDVPRSMSTLMRSQKIQSRASKAGYDFTQVEQVVQKVREELAEFLQADEPNRQMEGGDLLFAVVNLLRLSGVDSETALIASTEKFVRRVTECERILYQQGKVLKDLPLEQFDLVWSEAKRNVG